MDGGVEDYDRVLDCGFDRPEVCICFQLRDGRLVGDSACVRRRLHQDRRLLATSRAARFVRRDGNGPRAREGAAAYTSSHPLSVNIVETPATLGMSVGRWR